MIYPDVDPVEWSVKYKIRIKQYECLKCKKTFTTSIPIAMKGYRGLQSPVHECGEKFIRTILIPCDEDTKKKWNSFFG